MKTKPWIIAGLLGVALALMAAPVMAYNTTAVTGSVTSYVSISLNQSSIYLPLTAGTTATNSSLGITVSANSPFSVTVADASLNGKTTNYGYMSNFTGSSYDSVATALGSPLGLLGIDNGTTIHQTITGAIPTSGDPLYTGGAAVTNQVLANTLSQTVANTDLVLPSPSVYRIDLSFIIGPT